MTVTSNFFDTGDTQQAGRKLHYLTWGNRQNPHILVCVHGLARNARDFHFFAETLQQEYFIVAPDMAGRGASDWLTDSTRYNYGSYFADIAALLTSLGITQCQWVGTSMGGILGMMAASLTTSLVTALVLNDIGSMIPKAGLQRIFQYVGTPPLFTSKSDAEHFMRSVLAPFGITQQEHWQHLFAYSIRQEGAGYRLAYDPNIVESFRQESKNFTEVKDIDLSQFWNGVTCPALILRGKESDILTEATAKEMQRSRPNISLVEFEHIGHAPTLMDDKQIAVVREWLLKQLL